MSDNCIIKKHPEVRKYGRIDGEWKLDRVRLELSDIPDKLKPIIFAGPIVLATIVLSFKAFKQNKKPNLLSVVYSKKAFFH